MPLEDEIELNREFQSPDEALFLGLIYTNQLLERASSAFLASYALTPVQFNALMIVRDYERDGINQAQLAKRLLINRASTGTLIDILCARELLRRAALEGDRRAYRLQLTTESRRLLRRIHKPYYRRLAQVFSKFPVAEKRTVMKFLEKFRQLIVESS